MSRSAAPNFDRPHVWHARDVAVYLDMGVDWVYKHARNGTLPSFRMGGQLCFDAEEIRNWYYAQGRRTTQRQS